MTRRLVTMRVPGKFMDYMDGSSVMQQPDDALSERLRDALTSGIHQRSGSGYYVECVLDVDAAGLLADYADSCVDANLNGDRDGAELAAARRTLARLATEGVIPI